MSCAAASGWLEPVAAIFVTGTGTDVGKTFITATLVRHFRAAGCAVEAIKPLVSGFDAATLAASDPGVLLTALGRPATIEEIERISPWRFAAPMSPDLAAAREGRGVDFKAVVAFCQKAAAARSGTLFIEGVGGVMVTLDDTHTVLDWMSALRIPVLLVAGSYLGTISHTLTALHVLAQRNLDIAAVVVSESEHPGAPLQDTVATITRFADSIEVIGVPRLAGDASMHPALSRIAGLL
jgi:dethiobiotin synthetase